MLQLDSIWLSLQTQADNVETIKLDKRGRKRQLRAGKRMVVVVAPGLRSDGSGRRQLLDWQLVANQSKPLFPTPEPIKPLAKDTLS